MRNVEEGESSPFGARLKRARLKLGLTQEELARRVGVSSGWVSKVERGFKPPGEEFVYSVCVVLGEEAMSSGMKDFDERAELGC